MQFERAIAIPDTDKSVRKGIYASDAASILGFAPGSWQTAMDVYLRNVAGTKRDDMDPELSDYGQTIEPYVLRSLGRRIGKVVVPNTTTYVSREHPWLGATPDGFVPADDAGVEAKAITWTRDEWGEPETGQIPLHYACQVAVGMIVTGLPRWYVPVSLGGAHTELYIVLRDEPLLADILARLDEFRQKYVVPEIPPPVFTSADARALWPRDTGKTLTATDEQYQLVVELQRARAAHVQTEAVKLGLEVRVQAAMGDYSSLEAADGTQLVTWKRSRDGETVKADVLRAKYPEVWNELKEVKPGSRRFLLKI